MRLLLAHGAEWTGGTRGVNPRRCSCPSFKSIDDIGEPRGLTALGIACEHLNVPMVRRLIEAGANPEARDYDYMTARERLPPRTSLNAAERAAALEVLALASDRRAVTR